MENWSEDKKENRNAVEPSREKMHRLDEALDAIKKKYGKDAVKRASLMEQNREKKRQNSERKQT